MDRRTAAVGITAFMLLSVTSMARGQEPEQLPQPRPKQPAPPSLYTPYPPSYYVPYEPPVVPSVPPPMNSREGWAYFAPNYMGQMRPRVIMAPYGSYYLYNGWPYYGLSTGRNYLLPRTTD